jgi:hypothetical protein
LVALWEDKCVSPLRPALIDRASNEVVQGRNRLTGAPNTDQRCFREWNGLNWSRGLYLIFTRF